jgi:putative intracellular protease/amidase
MAKKILFVMTSNHRLGDTDMPTGYHLFEAAAPWVELTDAGFEVDFASPLGEHAPIDPNSMDRDNETNRRFLTEAKGKIDNTTRIENIDAGKYDAVYFPGGHGAMWDFPDNDTVHELVRTVYEKNNGLVAAICHGPAAFVGLKLSNGEYLVKGKRVSVFSDMEEKLVGRDKVVPFLLAKRLREQGARHEMADDFGESVSLDGRLVTGQNPASAKRLGEKLVELMKQRQHKAA